MSVTTKIVGVLRAMFGLSPGAGSGTAGATVGGTLIVRQSGGVAGTDEAQISYSGTAAVIAPMENVLEQRNAANAQAFRVYNTYTDDSNYERLLFGWTGSVAYVETQAAGTGNQRGLRLHGVTVSLMTNGSQRWYLPATGHLRAVDDNTYDFGDSGAERPRTVYVGTSVISPEFNRNAVAGATSTRSLVLKKTGIADTTATAVLTITVPNANHAAAIKLTFLSSNGSTDAFESSRVATGTVVLARTTGANVVAAVSTLEAAQIATVAGGATHTLAYDLSSITGAVGASNTFDIRVTIDDSGNLGSNQVVVLAELINSEASGVTMAAA